MLAFRYKLTLPTHLSSWVEKDEEDSYLNTDLSMRIYQNPEY